MNDSKEIRLRFSTLFWLQSLFIDAYLDIENPQLKIVYGFPLFGTHTEYEDLNHVIDIRSKTTLIQALVGFFFRYRVTNITLVLALESEGNIEVKLNNIMRDDRLMNYLSKLKAANASSTKRYVVRRQE